MAMRNLKKFVSNCGNLDEIFYTNKLSEKGKSGLIFDKSQTDILEKSWRSQHPNRMTAFKEKYKQSFHVHESSEEFLSVLTIL